MVVCVTHGLETDSGGDGVYDCVCVGKVREVSSLDALEVHGLKRQEIKTAVNDEQAK